MLCSPEDGTLHNRCCENLKSYILFSLVYGKNKICYQLKILETSTESFFNIKYLSENQGRSTQKEQLDQWLGLLPTFNL
jgi:hypothetical protein